MRKVRRQDSRGQGVKGLRSQGVKGFSDILEIRHNLLKTIREFFYRSDYLEVETPNLMKTALPDPYIDPLRVYLDDRGPFYLHTSPEMGMKKLLANGHDRIFQMCKVYRWEELEEVHSIEFTMLEWYMKGTYIQAMNEVVELISFIVDKLYVSKKENFKRPWKIYELERLFLEKTGINPFKLDRDGLFMAMKGMGFTGIDERDSWNDLFFKLFIQELECRIKEDAPYFIKDWPLSVSTMAKKKGTNKVERFELYINGLEIANGYTELLNQEEQRNRFLKDNKERTGLGKQTFKADKEFLEALSRLRGSYAGTSLGVDRLLMVLLHRDKIDDVMVERFRA